MKKTRTQTTQQPGPAVAHGPIAVHRSASARVTQTADRSPGLVLRAAAAPASKPNAARQNPVRVAPQSATNESNDVVAAVVVPAGGGASTGHVVAVAPAGVYAAPPGLGLRAFLHRDGSAIWFAGLAGGIHIGREQAQSEFGPLLPEAQAIFRTHPLPTGATASPAAVHRDADGAAPSGGLSALPGAMAASASKPLDAAPRAHLEQSYGTDLSGVRVHTDSAADQAAKSVQAHAFATGQDIYFRSGKYQTSTTDGQKLLAHEVAHTVQQANGTASTQRKADSSGLQISEPGDPLEVQAEQAAERAVRNQPTPIQGASGQLTPSIARFAGPGSSISKAVSQVGANVAAKAADAPTNPTPDHAAAGDSGSSVLGGAFFNLGGIARRLGRDIAALGHKEKEQSPPGSDHTEAASPKGREEPAPATPAPPVTAAADQAPENAAPASAGPSPAHQERSEGTFEAFGALTATGMAMQLPSLGNDIASQFGTDRDAVVATTPELRAFVPGQDAPTKAEAGPAAPSELPSAEAIALAPVAADAAAAPALDASVPPQPDGTAISTTAGPPPQFVPAGESDPNQVGIATNQAAATIRQGQQSIAAELAANRSANRIVPVGVDRSEGITLPDSKSTVNTTASEEMRAYLETDIPSNVRAIADSDFAPTITASLAAPRQAVAKAALERDVQRESALAEAQAEADRASLDARVEQHRLIADGRKQIETAKADAVKESQEKLDAYDRDAQQLKENHQKEIQQTIDTQQGIANSAIANGETQAAQQQAQADTLVAQDQAGGTRRPWMPRMGIFRFSVGGVKVGGAVGQVLDKGSDLGGKVAAGVQHVGKVVSDATQRAVAVVKDNVRKALEAAKSFAVGIIEKLKTTVAGMIRGFGEALKVLAAPLLVFFPQLRTRVNAAIDGVVDATTQVVNKVAEGLEKTVTAVVDKVSSVVNRVLDTFELVVVTSIALAQALMTGNFLDAAKIIFLAACKAVGIPGEEFLGILADAGGALLDIMKHPASFLGNLVKAVGGGVSKFMANFAQRMLGGLTEWLFGQVAQGGITLPTSFGPEAIFMLVLQVMGITYAHIRERVVLQLGEKAVSTIEKVMEPIEIMFTKGPGALWEWLKDQADQVKKSIIEAASQWLITQIITQAAIKLATMFTPVGAFVQAVLMMYNTIMFFVEKIKEIMAWVKSITTSLKNIAVGAIGTAVDYIDQSMAKAIPLIIEFLAKLVGIGGLGGQIRKVVQTLRGPVDKALDFLIGKLISGAKAVWGGIKAGAKSVKEKVVGWWNAATTFVTPRKEQHSLFYERDAQGARLMLASENKQPFDKRLEEAKSKGGEPAEVAKVEERRKDLRAAEESGENVKPKVDALGKSLAGAPRDLLDMIIPNHTGFSTQGIKSDPNDPIARDQAELLHESALGASAFGQAGALGTSAALNALMIAGVVGPSVGGIEIAGKAISLVGNELSLAGGALRSAGRGAMSFYLQHPVAVNEIAIFTTETVISVDGDVKGLLETASKDPTAAAQLFAQIWLLKLHIQIANGGTQRVNVKVTADRPGSSAGKLRLSIQSIEASSADINPPKNSRILSEAEVEAQGASGQHSEPSAAGSEFSPNNSSQTRTRAYEASEGEPSKTFHSYKELKAMIKAEQLSGRGKGLEAHHLLEKRFANQLGVNEDDILSAAVTPTWHRNVKQWGENIDYMISNELKSLSSNPANPSAIDIWRAHRRVYERIRQPEWAEAVYDTYFKPRGIEYYE